jgi:pSer/pThr/pTyr-binding forkhead associated (FHA) protein
MQTIPDDAVAATVAQTGPPPPRAPLPAPPPLAPPPGAEAFAPTITPKGAPLPPPPSAGFPPITPVPGSIPWSPPSASPPRAAVPFGRLVSVHRDGSDGQSFQLTGEGATLGKSDADLVFAEDRYLAWRHASFEKRGAGTILRPLDTVNGVYLRVRKPVALADGDQLLMGKEVLRFELVDVAEREPPQAVLHGVSVFASPSRAPWGRLRQLIVSGGARDVVHLHRPEIVLGREDGDLRFPDDEFMSRKHASIAWRDGRATLSDLGSSNGTYVRLRREHELEPGDLVRMGDQLFRFEPA